MMKKGGMTLAMPSKKLAIGAYARTSQHARTVLPYSRRAEHENESLKPSFHLCSFLLLKTLRLATDKTACSKWPTCENFFPRRSSTVVRSICECKESLPARHRHSSSTNWLVMDTWRMQTRPARLRSRSYWRIGEGIQMDLDTFSKRWGDATDSMMQNLCTANREKHDYIFALDTPFYTNHLAGSP